MAEINCDICLTDETLTFVNIANTTTTSKKFKIEAIGHNRIYACLDSDPSATFVDNVYSTCLSPTGGSDDDEDGVLYDALKSLTIEAFYIEDSNISLLKPEYQNLNGMTGHICNRSQFGMRINGLNVGFLNMNNDRVGEAFPLNNDLNRPAAISQTGTWAGMGAARYSRIDISEEQAYTLAALNNGSSLEICLARLLSNPHTGITWVRFSIRTSNGGLLKLYDQLVSLGRYYTFDILNPQLGITESNIPVINPQNLMTYISNVKVKYGSDNNFKSLPSLVAINPTINADIDFDIEVEDPSLNQSLTVIYQLQDSYPDMTMVDGRLSVHSSANFSNRLVVINVTVTSSIDTLNVIIQSIPVMLTALQIDLDASILYCQNGVWKTLETGTTIPNGTLQAMSGVSEIIMSDKVTDIGDDCFSVSSNSQVAWTKMKLSANLKTIGQSSLQSLGSLTTLVLPEGLLTIGNHSVQRLGGTLVIPQSLKVIPDGFLYDWNPKTYTINLRQTTLTTIRDGFENLQPANNGRYNILLPDSLLEFSGFRYMLVGKVQFGRNIQTIRQSAFGQSYDNFGSYVKVGEITILRADAMVEPLGVSPMGSIGFHADRKLKVPFALVDTYKGSAQWAKLVSNENIIGIDPDTYE